MPVLRDQIGPGEEDEVSFPIKVLFIEDEGVVLFGDPLDVTATIPELVPEQLRSPRLLVIVGGMLLPLRIHLLNRVGDNSV